MWLIIRKSDSAVIGTQMGARPPEGAWDPDLFEVKEWYGPEPAIHNPEEDIESYDPTGGDESLSHARLDFDRLSTLADDELAWLEAIEPQVETMDLTQLRGVLRRLVSENIYQIRAWRYLFKRCA